MAKQARKVSLISVWDYPRDKYSAYWSIGVTGDDDEGYRWHGLIQSYLPQKDCPNGTTLLEEQIGVAATRDEADTAAQQWALSVMPKYRRPEPQPQPQGGYIAHAMGPIGLLWELGERLWEKFSGWIFTLGLNVTVVRNPRLHVIRDAIDGGAGAGLLRIYDGSRPATCGTATTLLAELTFSDPCAGNAANGVLTMSAITADPSANAGGTATWFRAVDSTGTCVVDGTVASPSGGDLNLNSASISAGQEVSVSSFVLTEGNA